MTPADARAPAAALAVALVCLVVLLGLGGQALVRLHEDVQRGTQAREVQAAIEAVRLSLVDLESSQRGYLLTLDEPTLEPYLAAQARLDGQLRHLADLAAGTPVLADRVRALHRHAADQRSMLAQAVELARRRDTEAALARVRSGEARLGADRLRGLLAQVHGATAEALAERDQATAAWLERTIWLAGVLAVLATLLFAAACVLLARASAAAARALRAESAAKDAMEQRIDERTRELQRTVHALALSEARLGAILDSANDGVITADASQRIVFANRAAATLLRCPPAELIGAPLERFVPQRYRDRHRADVEAFGATDVATRRMGHRADVTALRADGEEFPVGAAISHVRVDDEHLYTVVLRDMTHRRRVEADLARSRDDLRRLIAAQHEVRENERRRIAREIHDDLQQTLAAIRIDLAAAAERIGGDPQEAARMLGEVDALAASALGSTRRIVNDLRPRVLDDLGLVPALEALVRQFAQRSAIEASIDHDAEPPADAPVAVVTCLYRVAQEALQNVAKHAGAERVEVRLECAARPGWVTLRVHDDGAGLAPADRLKPGSFGLLGMEERVRALGGTLVVAGGPGEGTSVEAALPMQRESGG